MPFSGSHSQFPLRKFYILKLKLVFPSGVAAACTIRSLHVGTNAARDAKGKTKALILAFCSTVTLRVVSEYAPAVLWDWHLFYALSRIGWTVCDQSGELGAYSYFVFYCLFVCDPGDLTDEYTWVGSWQWTPAFIGASMLTGIVFWVAYV